MTGREKAQLVEEALLNVGHLGGTWATTGVGFTACGLPEDGRPLYEGNWDGVGCRACVRETLKTSGRHDVRIRQIAERLGVPL